MTTSHGQEPQRFLAGRYRLVRRIGRGGMADVHTAEDELLRRTVAVKVFRVDTDDPVEAARIGSEMRILAGLRHPGLVTLYDANVGDDSSGTGPYLVMEYVPGGSLRARLDLGPLASGPTAMIGVELASALSYVHDQGLVHRDVKPANVLLDRPMDVDDPGARLADFGLARLVDGTRMTLDGSTVGTANYLSPEQARGEPVGPPTDVYALGLLLLECRTGEVAFAGSGIEAAVARLHRPPHMPAELGPDWVTLLGAMTQLDPDARPDLSGVLGRLRELAAPANTEALGTMGAADLATTALGPAATTPLGAAAAVPPGATAVLPGVPAVATHAQTRTPHRRRRVGILAGALIVLTGGLLTALLTAGGDPAVSGTNPSGPGGTTHTSRSPVAGSSTSTSRSAPHPPSTSPTHRSSSTHRTSPTKHKSKSKTTGPGGGNGGPAAPKGPGKPPGGGPGKGPGKP